MIVPWMAKDWIYAANPVAPFFNKLFRNPYRRIVAEQEYARFSEPLQQWRINGRCRSK